MRKPTSGQRAIANYFQEQASWRDGKASEYPDDMRNVRSAEGLRELAEYTLGLPDDDERIIELTALAVRDDMFMPFEDGARMTSRFRFDDAGEECGVFLDRLARMTSGEALDFAREHGVIESAG